jgi:hypothetical protein
VRDVDFRGADMRNTEFIAAQVEGALVDDDVDTKAIGFGEPTRRISIPFRDGDPPTPVSRKHLMVIQPLEELGIEGFDDIPDLLCRALDPETMKDEFLAGAAVYAVGPQLLIAGGLPVLLDALRHERDHIRRNATEILTRCGEHARPALAALIRMLCDADPTVRNSAAHALGEIGLAEREVLSALHAACEDADERVRTAAQQALVTIMRGPQKWD